MESYLLIKVLSFIAAVLTLLYVLFKTLKRLGWSSQHNEHGLINIVEYKRLNQRTSFLALKLEEQLFLVAMHGESLHVEPIKSAHHSATTLDTRERGTE